MANYKLILHFHYCLLLIKAYPPKQRQPPSCQDIIYFKRLLHADNYIIIVIICVNLKMRTIKGYELLPLLNWNFDCSLNKPTFLPTSTLNTGTATSSKYAYDQSDANSTQLSTKRNKDHNQSFYRYWELLILS